MILLLTSCAPRVKVIKLSDLSPEVLTEASKVQVFRLDNPTPKPDIEKYVGEITAYSCKHLMTDPPATNEFQLVSKYAKYPYWIKRPNNPLEKI